MSPLATLSEAPRRDDRPSRLWAAVRAALVGGAFVWAYYPVLTSLTQRWWTDPQYSHGFLVPVMALLVWWGLGRKPSSASPDPSWWGAVPLLVGVALWLTGAFFYFVWLDSLSLLPVLAGLTLLLGGWKSARAAWPAIALLFFMLPLPFQVEGALSELLQMLATRSSAYLLVILGLPAVPEGNVLLIGDMRLGVLEACNGLGLLSAFFALSATTALIARRPWFDRVVVFFSAIPVALLMNIGRVAATGVAFSYLADPATRARLHDAAGWLMMPMALVTLWLELWLLARLIVTPAATGPVPLDRRGNTWKASPGPARPAAAGTASAH
jgi:exosortase